MPLDVLPDDRCCGPKLAKALRKTPDIEKFDCPCCGCEWTCTIRQEMRVWEFIPLVVFL